MVYASKTEFEQVSFYYRLRCKLGKIFAQHAPHNSIRKWGLRLCGFKLGEKVYVGQDLIVASIVSEKSCNLIIGDRVAIGPRVTIALSSDANWSNLMNIIEFKKSTVILEDDCWLGAGVIILPGVTVGKSAIVGAGSVVTKSIPPFHVFAGVPAKKINIIESKRK